ncbi:MAG: glycine zipper domain-containing protein [Chthonomonadales bacterium]
MYWDALALVGGVMLVAAPIVWHRHKVLAEARAAVREIFTPKCRSFRERFREFFPTGINPPAHHDKTIDGGCAIAGAAGLPNVAERGVGDTDQLGVVAALGESAVTAGYMVAGLLAVDQHFYGAISELAGHQITTFADLHAHVADYASTFLGGVKEGVVTKVQGHVAEQVVAEHLQKLGHHVEFAPTSNQAGYDLVVDHHFLVNVKDHVDMGGIYEHFAHNPDIPVIVGAHTEGVPIDALHIDAASGLDQFPDAVHGSHAVIVDNGLDHDALASHTRAALDAAAGHVPLHVPWITLGLSGWREGKLLLNQKTDFERALRNIGLDAAGTGIGGATGAKVGGVVGTFLAPGVGTLVGAVVGGIAGALGGRHVTNQVKYAPLRAAQEAYQEAYGQLSDTMTAARQEAETAYERARQAASGALQNVAQSSQSAIVNTASQCEEALRFAATLAPAQEAKLLDAARSAMTAEWEKAGAKVAELRAQPIWLRVFWPNSGIARTLEHWRAAKHRRREFERRVRKILERVEPGPKRAEALFDAVLQYGYGEREADEYLIQLREHVERNRQRLGEAVDVALRAVLDCRAQQVNKLRELVERLARELEARIKPYADRLRSAEHRLRTEMQKFGVDPGT